MTSKIRILRAVVAAVAILQTILGSAPNAYAADRCLGRATIVGTGGADVLRGTSRKDVIAGLGGDDTVVGLGGKDRLCGGDGEDVLTGGGGIDGGNGTDACEGRPSRTVSRRWSRPPFVRSSTFRGCLGAVSSRAGSRP